MTSIAKALIPPFVNRNRLNRLITFDPMILDGLIILANAHCLAGLPLDMHYGSSLTIDMNF